MSRTIAIRIACGLLLAAVCLQERQARAEVAWPAGEWLMSSPEEVGLARDGLEAARDYALAGDGSGCIVRYGKRVLIWGDQQHRYDLKSTSKSIGVTALGLALADGKVSLQDRAVDRHPRFGVPPTSNRATGWLDEVTLFHLATMTAGFEKPGGYEPMVFRPGTQWHYSDGGPNWLAEILTLAYDADLQDVLRRRVFGKIGITEEDLHWRRHAYRPPQLQGIPRREFGSGVHANVDAMARIGLLYLRGGKWRDEQLLPAEFVEAAGTPFAEVRELPVREKRPEDIRPGTPSGFGDAAAHYGLLWWNNADGTLEDVPRDTYWSWGLYDSLIVVIPSHDLVVARAGRSWPRQVDQRHYDVLQPFLGPICRAAR